MYKSGVMATMTHVEMYAQSCDTGIPPTIYSGEKEVPSQFKYHDVSTRMGSWTSYINSIRTPGTDMLMYYFSLQGAPTGTHFSLLRSADKGLLQITERTDVTTTGYDITVKFRAIADYPDAEYSMFLAPEYDTLGRAMNFYTVCGCEGSATIRTEYMKLSAFDYADGYYSKKFTVFTIGAYVANVVIRTPVSNDGRRVAACLSGSDTQWCSLGLVVYRKELRLHMAPVRM